MCVYICKLIVPYNYRKHILLGEDLVDVNKTVVYDGYILYKWN